MYKYQIELILAVDFKSFLEGIKSRSIKLSVCHRLTHTILSKFYPVLLAAVHEGWMSYSSVYVALHPLAIHMDLFYAGGRC